MNFDFDFAVFPKPSKPSYSLYNPNLIWIPRTKNNDDGPAEKEFSDIPCLFLPYSEPSDKLIVYFHGNSEDIGDTELLFFPLRSVWKFHILSVEYPSYGQYQKHPPLSEESIYQDAETVYQHITRKFRLKESQIILFGRSLGTAPAIHLASLFKPLALILISPFCSIRAAAGALSFPLLAKLVRERFDNQTKIQLVTCPLMIIHGMKDALVPVGQSHTLINLALSEKKRLVTPPEMTHSEFDLLNDVGIPISRFVGDITDGKSADLGISRVIPPEEHIDWEKFFGAHKTPTLESTITEKTLEDHVTKSPLYQESEPEPEIGSMEPPENFHSSRIDERKQ